MSKINKYAYNIFAGTNWPSYDDYLNDNYIDNKIKKEIAELEKDATKINLGYEYQSVMSSHINFKELTKQQQHYLTESKVFCMYPWIHIHAYPDGRAYPCCGTEMDYPIGDFKKDTMEIVWNSQLYKDIRKNMLEGTASKGCQRCYEQEKAGFVSMRRSANQHFGHHINLVDKTMPDGQFDDFKIRYYDIRFSNLCNMSCRTCGSLFSSSWYNEETKLYGDRYHPQIMFTGKTKDDMWEQFLPHIPYIEQIYFAGGEPLIMEEHYNILKELVRQKRFDIKLIYNTNFSRLNLKDEDVLDYWKLFDVVSIGASLDAMDARGEYIRKGTKWDDIMRNRESMLKKCPNVDFYISSTVSLYNILHVPDFHYKWVNQGFIKHADWNINILQSPARDRIDVLPKYYKDLVKDKINSHIDWLKPYDLLKRATSGYEGILNFMDENDNSHLLKEFFRVNDMHDAYRNEKFETVFPEYKDLRNYVTT